MDVREPQNPAGPARGREGDSLASLGVGGGMARDSFQCLQGAATDPAPPASFQQAEAEFSLTPSRSHGGKTLTFHSSSPLFLPQDPTYE